MSEQKGRALMLVDKQITDMSPVKIETPKFGRVVWNLMEVQGLFDLFKSFLLLPAQYDIIGVYFDAMRQMWTLLLESEELPELKVNMEPYHLMPEYWLHEDGKVSIKKIKIMDW